MTETPTSDDAARAIAAGFLVVDEATLRSIMQTAILDAHTEAEAKAQLRYEASLLAEKSAENEKLRERAEAAEHEIRKRERWWHRWMPSAAIVSVVAGILALGTSVYLIGSAEDALAHKAKNLLSEQLLDDVMTIVVQVAESEVALSEALMDERLLDVELQLSALRVDVRTEVRDELATFRADLLRELRQDTGNAAAAERPL